MRSQTLAAALSCLVLAGCGQYGHVASGSAAAIDEDLPLVQQAEAANSGQPGIEYRKLDDGEVPLVDDVPVGTIIAHFGPWQFSDKWQIAMGQEIRDPDSPFYGRKVPDLNGALAPFQPTYIAGTLDTGTYNRQFGSNELPEGGAHAHGGQTGAGGGRHGSDNDDDFSAATSGHVHGVATDGAHDHGGDNRPRSVGIVYLIRIK